MLASLSLRRVAGTVVLIAGGERHTIVIREGSIDVIDSPVAPLEEVLVTLGTLAVDEVDFALHRAEEVGTPFGAQLVADGLAEEETLSTALSAQIEERLAAFGAFPSEARYEVFLNDDLLAGKALDRQPVDILAAVTSCVRGMADQAAMDKVLLGLGDRRLALHSAAQVPRFAFVKDEAKMAEVIQWSWHPYPSLLESLEEDKLTFKRVAYALAITCHVDLGEEAWPLDVVRPPPRPAKVKAPEPEPEPAPAPRVSAAPARLSALPPPPPPPRPPAATQPTLSHVREVEAPPSRTPVSSQSVRTVDAPPSRPPFRSDPSPSTPPPRASSPSIDFVALPPPSRAPMASRPPETWAAMSDEEKSIEAGGVRRKAEVLLERGDHVGAEKLATQAFDLDRNNPEGLALLGWLRSMKPGASSIADGLKLLDESVKRNPKSDRALFLRGSLLKRSGRTDDAIRDFRKAAELNPKNIDAVREVRLHTIRAGGNEKAGTKRLIGKLFGK